jgi:hypothetical protein
VFWVEIFWVFEEQPAGSLQDLAVHKIGFMLEFSPEVREPIVIEFDEMEMVEDMNRMG